MVSRGRPWAYWLGALVALAVFGGVHTMPAEPSWYVVVDRAILGVAFMLAFHRWGMWTAMLGHALYNIVARLAVNTAPACVLNVWALISTFW